MPLRRLGREGVHSRSGARLPATRPFGPGLPAPELVPPSWFSTTSTVFSSNTVRTSCSPLPTVGFTSFPGTVPSSSPRCVPPFEAFPPSAATSRFRDPLGIGHPRHRHRRPGSPAPLPSRGSRFTPSDSLSGSEDSVPKRTGRELPTCFDRPGHLRALLHARVRCRPDSCPSARPVAPWGLGIRAAPPFVLAHARYSGETWNAGTSKTGDGEIGRAHV